MPKKKLGITGHCTRGKILGHKANKLVLHLPVWWVSSAVTTHPSINSCQVRSRDWTKALTSPLFFNKSNMVDHSYHLFSPKKIWTMIWYICCCLARLVSVSIRLTTYCWPDKLMSLKHLTIWYIGAFLVIYILLAYITTRRRTYEALCLCELVYDTFLAELAGYQLLPDSIHSCMHLYKQLMQNGINCLVLSCIFKSNPKSYAMTNHARIPTIIGKAWIFCFWSRLIFLSFRLCRRVLPRTFVLFLIFLLFSPTFALLIYTYI